MLLHLKQMTGRLIRSEADRGIVVIVEPRRDRGYFPSLTRAFPDRVQIRLESRSRLPEVLAELGLVSDTFPNGFPGGHTDVL